MKARRMNWKISVSKRTRNWFSNPTTSSHPNPIWMVQMKPYSPLNTLERLKLVNVELELLCYFIVLYLLNFFLLVLICISFIFRILFIHENMQTRFLALELGRNRMNE